MSGLLQGFHAIFTPRQRQVSEVLYRSSSSACAHWGTMGHPLPNEICVQWLSDILPRSTQCHFAPNLGASSSSLSMNNFLPPVWSAAIWVRGCFPGRGSSPPNVSKILACSLAPAPGCGDSHFQLCGQKLPYPRHHNTVAIFMRHNTQFSDTCHGKS